MRGRHHDLPTWIGGFGYDPLFLVSGTDQTMAELSEAEKNRVSHRARAARELAPLLESVLRGHNALVERLERR